MRSTGIGHGEPNYRIAAVERTVLLVVGFEVAVGSFA
jgi:hypothetical protein